MHAYMEHASAALEMRAARNGAAAEGSPQEGRQRRRTDREGAVATKQYIWDLGQNDILARYVSSKVKTRPNIYPDWRERPVRRRAYSTVSRQESASCSGSVSFVRSVGGGVTRRSCRSRRSPTPAPGSERGRKSKTLREIERKEERERGPLTLSLSPSSLLLARYFSS